MSFQIQETPSVFGRKQFKYILDDFNDNFDPELSTLMKKFNHVHLPRTFEKYLVETRHLKIYEDDIWVITYPKSGTTWCQEAVWQICNDVDVDNKVPMQERFPFLEGKTVTVNPKNEADFETINKLKRPRFIKAHLPIAFLPKKLWEVKPKILYVMRDAKDTAVSYFHHYYNLFEYSGKIKDFLELFLRGEVEFGDYWDHLEQFYVLQSLYPNLKMIKFEDFKHNMDIILKDLCNFLQKNLSEKKLSVLKQYLQFDKMKVNPAVCKPHLNNFIQKQRPGSDFTFLRRGQTGAYKDEMPQQFIEKFDEKTKNRFSSEGWCWENYSSKSLEKTLKKLTD